MNPYMFREYDIRGIAGKDMTNEDVGHIGRGVGTFLKQQGAVKISVGHECRLTSESYAQNLIEGLDLGIGFDGDGDRIGVVDEAGRLVYGDKLMIIYAREILKRKPGATFISEVKCFQAMYDDIEKHGGRAIMWRTGHSLIKKKMKAELAGKMSGHMFFKDRHFGFDDATYAACRLLEILAATGLNISEMLADVPPTFTTPEIRVDCPGDVKFGLVQKAIAYFSQNHNVIDIDGARVIFDDGWGLVRASNTQPALVLRFEALSNKRLNDIRKLIEGELYRLKSET